MATNYKQLRKSAKQMGMTPQQYKQEQAELDAEGVEAHKGITDWSEFITDEDI